MILWSKGLGKLVLKMSLADRSSTSEKDEKLFIEGTMGPPTHWDYSVSLNEDDVLDFVELLKQPAPVRFVVEAESTGRLVLTALKSGILFAGNTARCFLGLAPASTSVPTATTSTTTTPMTAGAKKAKESSSAQQTSRSE